MDTFIKGVFQVSGISVPMVSTELDIKDFMGAVMVRWGINRDNYRVRPGLYATGTPGPESDVLVTANYKLTFDTLRSNLSNLDVWILVLDTKGVNVWCAAGKGTFGTKELVNRIKEVLLDKLVNHKRIIVPQLGATGVSAHKVKEETGFNVHYGPVRASDVKRFIRDGYRADRDMRRVTFGFIERIKLIPNDFMYGKYYLIVAMTIVFLISCINSNGWSFTDFSHGGGTALLNVFFAYLSGIVITPLFLTYIPARLFSLKGFYVGSLVFIALLLKGRTGSNIFETIAWFFIMTSISSFLAMNFTGSSTYTSLSGVRREMKISLPLQIGSAVIGIVLLVIGNLN
jgi:hypothetical protein